MLYCLALIYMYVGITVSMYTITLLLKITLTPSHTHTLHHITFHVRSMSVKFHGTIAQTTPIGAHPFISSIN